MATVLRFEIDGIGRFDVESYVLDVETDDLSIVKWLDRTSPALAKWASSIVAESDGPLGNLEEIVDQKSTLQVKFLRLTPLLLERLPAAKPNAPARERLKLTFDSCRIERNLSPSRATAKL